MGEEDGEASGSEHNIPPFHLLDALESMLESMKDLFNRFGGHRTAAGLAMDSSGVEEFRRRFNQYTAERLTPEDFRHHVELDGLIDLREVNDQSIAQVLVLALCRAGCRAWLIR